MTEMTERRAKIEETKNMAKKKYVRYKEGAELYSMGLSKFQQMAHEAKATYKVDKLVLVSIEKFEKYLETFAEDL
jgi:hypothetical protein